MNIEILNEIFLHFAFNMHIPEMQTLCHMYGLENDQAADKSKEKNIKLRTISKTYTN